MNKISVLLLSGLLLVSGCTIGGDQVNDDFSGDFPAPTPSESGDLADATVEEDSPVVGTVASNLIPSTDPQSRLQQIQQGKNDPFGVTPPRATIQYQTPPRDMVETAAGGNGRRTGTVGRNGTQTADGVRGQQVPQVRPDGTVILPPGTSLQDFPDFLPPEPDPLYAQGIFVSGIIDVGGENIAIMSTPGSSSVRSVRVGDFIPGGDSSVMVRSIDISRPPGQAVSLREDNSVVQRNIAPLGGSVTFEERGERVIKRVGEPNVTAEPNS